METSVGFDRKHIPSDRIICNPTGILRFSVGQLDSGRIPSQRRIMKVSELIEKLKTCDLEAEVWLPNVNELGISGYCVLDHVLTLNFNEVENDVMHNPGKIDKRLLKDKTDSSQIVYLGSIADFITDGLDKPAENR